MQSEKGTPENTDYGITEKRNKRISEFQLLAFFIQKPILSLHYSWKVLHVCVKMLATCIDFIRGYSATRPYKIYAYIYTKCEQKPKILLQQPILDQVTKTFNSKVLVIPLYLAVAR